MEPEFDINKFYNGEESKILITNSSDKRCTKYTHKFTEELNKLFRNGKVVNKYGATMKKITRKATEAGFNDLIVVGEDHRQINRMIHVHLPNGPTAIYRMSGVKLPKEIHNHASQTSHNPEMQLTNFKTPIGIMVSTMLKNLFPPGENLYGRQVATWQNHKDYIFFRQYRYMFESKEKAALQEIGPRFTLKLQKLLKGLYSTGDSDIIWSFKVLM
ncbi:hypothetical protein HZS_554 [Henneguya salminicola]|nr:hypothetical protein HZS_554 [Henneguya salminicola]